MTKEEFKSRWESDDEGGGIDWNDIANCSIEWKLESKPKTKPISLVRYIVLKAANTIDAEDYKPQEE